MRKIYLWNFFACGFVLWLIDFLKYVILTMFANYKLLLSTALAFCFQCNTNQDTMDKFIYHIDLIYKNLIIDARVEDITEEEYSLVNSQEATIEAGGEGTLKQKIVSLNAELNIAIYQQVESKKGKRFRKVTGKTDASLQKTIAEVVLVGLKCYDYTNGVMDEKCKREGIENVIAATRRTHSKLELCESLKKEIEDVAHNLETAREKVNRGIISDTLDAIIISCEIQLKDLKTKYFKKCQ